MVGRRENQGNPWKSGLAGAIEFEAKGNWASGDGRRSREGKEDGRRILDDEFRDEVGMFNKNFGRSGSEFPHGGVKMNSRSPRKLGFGEGGVNTVVGED